MPHRDAVETHGPFVPQPTRPARMWRLVHHHGPNLGDDTEYTVTCGGDDSVSIRELRNGRVTATFTLPAAVVRALAPVLAEAVSHDEPPVAEVDPELEQLLREEEELEWQAKAKQMAISYAKVPVQVSAPHIGFVVCSRCSCVLVLGPDGVGARDHTAWHVEHG